MNVFAWIVYSYFVPMPKSTNRKNNFCRHPYTLNELSVRIAKTGGDAKNNICSVKMLIDGRRSHGKMKCFQIIFDWFVSNRMCLYTERSRQANKWILFTDASNEPLLPMKNYCFTIEDLKHNVQMRNRTCELACVAKKSKKNKKKSQTRAGNSQSTWMQNAVTRQIDGIRII